MTQKAPPPWAPAKADVPDVAALKALSRGEASPDQQKRALNWILNEAADTYGPGWYPENPDFAAGKRHVGRQIVGYVNVDMEAFKRASQPKKVADERRKR